MTSLTIAGTPVADLHRYTLRWAVLDTGALPMLYCDGKRVTKPWELKVEHEEPKDAFGGNANTA